jgi:hypothetical protein
LSIGLTLSFDAAIFPRSGKSAILGDWHIGTTTPSGEDQIDFNDRHVEALIVMM